MEYFLGSVITIIALWVFSKLEGARPDTSPIQVTYSQSHVFELVKPFIPDDAFLPPIVPTQSLKHLSSITTRVLFMENQAYFIKNNTLFVAEIIDGEVAEESAVAVDTMGMNKVQLDKTIFIVEQLREGLLDDSWDSGDSQL
jgi:hypothetical protein